MLIPGTQLDDHQRRIVLDAFRYRWTSDNPWRDELWKVVPKWRHPKKQLVTDAEWLATYSFHFTRDGARLHSSRRYADETVTIIHGGGEIHEQA